MRQENTLSQVPDDILISAWRHAMPRRMGGTSEDTAAWLLLNLPALGETCRQVLYQDLKSAVEKHERLLAQQAEESAFWQARDDGTSGPLGSGTQVWLRLWESLKDGTIS